jgi:hypothetical protein
VEERWTELSLVELLHLRARRGDGEEADGEAAAAAEWVRAAGRKGRRGLAIEAMAPKQREKSRNGTGKSRGVLTQDFLCEVESGRAMHGKHGEMIRGFICFDVSRWHGRKRKPCNKPV